MSKRVDALKKNCGNASYREPPVTGKASPACVN